MGCVGCVFAIMTHASSNDRLRFLPFNGKSAVISLPCARGRLCVSGLALHACRWGTRSRWCWMETVAWQLSTLQLTPQRRVILFTIIIIKLSGAFLAKTVSSIFRKSFIHVILMTRLGTSH